MADRRCNSSEGGWPSLLGQGRLGGIRSKEGRALFRKMGLGIKGASQRLQIPYTLSWEGPKKERKTKLKGREMRHRN